MENWLSHLEISGGGSGSSSVSFEEILSFNGGQSCDHSSNNKDNNIIIIGDEANNKQEKKNSKRGSLGNNNNNKRTTKKARNSIEALDHIMSERKRRQQMAEKFIALAAAIPGLKKIDKASILQEAINYVKELQERIALLEKETNNKEQLIVKKSQFYCSSLPCDKNNNNNNIGNEMVLPEVEARLLEKELLIRIHCEKRNGIMLELLAFLENNNLSLACSSFLPFGNSTLNVIIIALMNEEFNLTLKDLVKTLREYLLKFMRCNNNNCGPC
ncbi:transcription factor bHLH19-like [Arachis stenosperma]|uniref:transcription factor bHLH19-like n=1 Tax=Arachis stenosperma TaxID=217475 RepID=UPI0025ABE249|nr:transcription factor bHLH19-like [Arachis stenosperma]